MEPGPGPEQPQDLAQALLKLEGTVRANGVALQAGLGELRRQMEALQARLAAHLEYCQRECRTGLQDEILTNERQARKREHELMRELIAQVGELHGDHERRLRVVERWQWRVAGMAAIIGAAVAAAGRLILGVIS